MFLVLWDLRESISSVRNIVCGALYEMGMF